VTSVDYLTKIQAVKGSYLDALWNAGTGQYEADNGSGAKGYTWLNAFMVQVSAILAGQGQASADDISRAVAVVGKLIAAPCYANYTWTHLMDGTSDRHEAVDQPVAECLYFAWKYRTELGLAAPTVTSIVTILTTNRTVAVEEEWQLYGGQNLNVTGTYDNQNLAKWQLNRLTYGKLAGGSLDAQIQACLKRFVQYIDTPFGAQGAYSALQGTALFPDYGWRYIDDFPWQSAEYGEMALGGMLLYYPEIETAAALTAGEIAQIKAWERHILGQWQRNGYLNWDTVWSDDRLHLLSYWMWSLRALLGIARSPALNQGASDHLYAKWLLDQAVSTFDHMDTWNSDPDDGAVGKLPFGTTEDIFGGDYNNVKASGNAKFIMELALAVDLGIADQASADPENLWGWGWENQHLHVSTPTYSAASLPYAPTIDAPGWGADAVQSPGDGLSRITLPTGEILTSLGGYDQEAFSFKVVRDGVTEINTGSSTTGKPTSHQVWRDGAEQTRVDYDTTEIPTTFDTSIRTLNKRNGTNYRTEVDTTFYPTYITTTYRAVRTGTAGTGQVVLSIPCRQNVVIDYMPLVGAKTVVWDGASLTPAGTPRCKYIHMKWSQWSAGLLLVPTSGSLASGAKVTALGSDPSGYPARQPDQDRSLLVYLADDAPNLGNVSITFSVRMTDGTDAGAESAWAAAGESWPSGLLSSDGQAVFLKNASGDVVTITRAT
jgi:hypothetical protein